MIKSWIGEFAEAHGSDTLCVGTLLGFNYTVKENSRVEYKWTQGHRDIGKSENVRGRIKEYEKGCPSEIVGVGGI